MGVSSHHRVSAAHRQRLARDEAGGVGSEEDRSLGDILGLADTAERVGLGDARLHLGGAERAIALGGPHAEPSDVLVGVRDGHARAHHVEPYAVASDLARHALAERDDTGLAGGIDALAKLSHAPGVGSQAHDGAGLPGDHAVQDGTGAVDHSPEVELDLLLPLRALLLHEEAIMGPAHVVHEHVYPAPPAFYA